MDTTWVSGTQDPGSIPGETTIIFKMELISIRFSKTDTFLKSTIKNRLQISQA